MCSIDRRRVLLHAGPELAKHVCVGSFELGTPHLVVRIVGSPEFVEPVHNVE